METNGQKEAGFAQQEKTGYMIGGQSDLVDKLAELKFRAVGGRPTEQPQVCDNS